jgi:small-conductance mechanosensitive channel
MKFNIAPTWAKLQAMLDAFFALLPNLVLALLVFALFVLLARWIKALIRRFCSHHGHQHNVGLVIGRLGSALIILMGLLVSLSVVLPSFKAADLIQVLGLSSVAIGFAFRDVLQNFLAGVLLLLTQPFRVGEEISVDGHQGFVQEIQTRATLIKTSDGFLVVIPNATIYTQKITVLNAYDAQRSTVDFVISHDADPDLARELMIGAISGIEGVLQDPAPSAVVTDVADNGLRVQARWWTDSRRSDDVQVKDKVIPAIKRALSEHDIELPFPTREVFLRDQSASANGDRAAAPDQFFGGDQTGLRVAARSADKR